MYKLCSEYVCRNRPRHAYAKRKVHWSPIQWIDLADLRARKEFKLLGTAGTLVVFTSGSRVYRKRKWKPKQRLKRETTKIVNSVNELPSWSKYCIRNAMEKTSCCLHKAVAFFFFIYSVLINAYTECKYRKMVRTAVICLPCVIKQVRAFFAISRRSNWTWATMNKLKSVGLILITRSKYVRGTKVRK